MTYFIALLIVMGTWIHVPSGEWEPTPQDVEEIQGLLKPYVNDQAVVWREELSPWERYTIQYQGQVVDGKKVVFINAMCDEPPERVVRELVYTFDGGACYFRMHWDPATKRFFDFSFNGYA